MVHKNFFVILIISPFLSFLSSSTDTLVSDRPLFTNETLVSSDGTFSLGFFSPSNSKNNLYIGVQYKKIPDQAIIWVGNRKNPATSPSAVLRLMVNGSLLITDGNSTVFWSSGLMSTVSNPIGQLLDNGNFVVRDASTANSGSFAWQSFDYPTDSLIPGMKLGWNLTSGLNRNLTAWASPTDPSPGNYTLTLDLRGDPQLYFWSGPNLQWRSGPWTGIDFSGQLPVTKSYANTFSFHFFNSTEEIYYTVDVVDKSTLTRLVVNQSGLTQRYVWLDGSNVWNVYWYTPSGPCDFYAGCGPYGVCQPNGSPMCTCLQGFEPKSPNDWALRYYSGGCVRKTQLDCKKMTDGFVTISETQLPDTVGSVVDMTMSLDECRALCSQNCSCTGYASADISKGGRGCIMWFTKLMDISVYSDGGQDFYLRLAAADLGSTPSQSNKAEKPTLAIMLSVILGMILLLAGGGCYAWRKKKRTRGNNTSVDYKNTVESTEGDDMELPLYDLLALRGATNNFSDENKLGEGGFGPVYKGTTKEGQEIAVKKLSKTSVQGLDELKTEVMLVAKLQHRNLVRLLGWCIQGDERMLIYEYMPNKSLDAFLFDKEVVSLDWNTRYQIIIGIARGLLYLHQDSRFRIIHRDLKASNILLDEDMNPKISDFGLARIFGGDETKTKTRRVVGTFGYMSPEYALNGIFSVKSDVFSFGVIVLEIVSGKRNKGVFLSDAEEYLLGKAWAMWKEGNGLKLLDESLDRSFLLGEVLKCIKVGLLCVQERPEDRPTMSSVVLMLGSDSAFLPEPKPPGFVARKSPGESSSSLKDTSNSVNDVTITMTLAR